MTTTKIEWTDETVNVVTGCRKVSAGCEHCYAETFAGRGMGPWKGRDFTEVRTHPERLEKLLRKRKPQRIFTNSMGDPFHEDVPDEFLDLFFAVMALTPHLTYQVLTKRPERMRAYLSESGLPERVAIAATVDLSVDSYTVHVGQAHADRVLWVWGANERDVPCPVGIKPWPLPNVHMGVSVEDQAAADARVPILLDTLAAVRWVSAEPLLGPVDLERWLRQTTRRHVSVSVSGALRNRSFDGLTADGEPLTTTAAEKMLLDLEARGVKRVPAEGCDDFDEQHGCRGHAQPRLSWVVTGGESGPGARPCDVAWIRSIVEQCKAAGTPCFVKQLGAFCYYMPPGSGRLYGLGEEDTKAAAEELGDILDGTYRYGFKHPKGGDPSEWPADLRVRELPA